MKKLIALFLTILMCLALFASCANEPETPEDTTTKAPEETTTKAPEETTTQNGNNGTPTPDQNPGQDAPKPPEVGEDGELEMPEIPI